MNNEWKPKLIWSLAISIIAVFILVMSFGGLKKGEPLLESSEKKMTLGKCDFNVTTAVTEEEKARGLMGMKDLASDQAMTFPFDKSNVQTFWMKNMLIPIDLVWLDNNKVIGWEENMRPDNGERVYQSPAPSNLVLEAAEGTIKRCEIEIGSEIQF